MSTYSEKLKDPRWQKLRLKILDRDNWSCVYCGDTGQTLHVHHLYYDNNLEPWEYEDKDLITLCEHHHGAEHKFRKELEEDLLKFLKKQGFLSVHLISLMNTLNELGPIYNRDQDKEYDINEITKRIIEAERIIHGHN